MITYKVTYRHGHFIDLETNLRILPVQGAEYSITANVVDFKTEDTKLLKIYPLSENEKENWVSKKYGEGNFVRILKAGQQLFFRVGNSKTEQGDEDHQYIFVCTLLEDLYLYQLPDRKGDEEEDWRLSECECVLDRCIMGGMNLTERITASSLNSLFGNTVQFYFSLQRSTATNVYTNFFLYKENMEINHGGLINRLYEGLQEIRKKIVNRKSV